MSTALVAGDAAGAGATTGGAAAGAGVPESALTVEAASVTCPSRARRLRFSTTRSTWEYPVTSFSQASRRGISRMRWSPFATPFHANKLSWDPNPAARRIAYSTGNSPPGDNRRLPRSGSGSLRLGIGGTRPYWSAFKHTASSSPAPMEWPVNPLVLVTMTSSAPAPKALRKALISAAADPPRAGV